MQVSGPGALRGEVPAEASGGLRGHGALQAGLRGLQDRPAGGLQHPRRTRRNQPVGLLTI